MGPKLAELGSRSGFTIAGYSFWASSLKLCAVSCFENEDGRDSLPGALKEALRRGQSAVLALYATLLDGIYGLGVADGMPVGCGWIRKLPFH